MLCPYRFKNKELAGLKVTKAQEIIPEDLLQKLQQHIQGETIYIPKKQGRLQWGAQSGNREYYDKRNQQIKEAFYNGRDIEDLATQYCLAIETIKKIIYRKE